MTGEKKKARDWNKPPWNWYFRFYVLPRNWFWDRVLGHKEAVDRASAYMSWVLYLYDVEQYGAPVVKPALMPLPVWKIYMKWLRFVMSPRLQAYGERYDALSKELRDDYWRKQEERVRQWEKEAWALHRKWQEQEKQWRSERERAEQERARERARQEQKERANLSPYEISLKILGLTEPFTKGDLSRAYRKRMQKAHPDAGGSTKEAQAVNAARALIMKHRGW